MTFFYKIHNNLVIPDKNKYLSEAGRGNRSTRYHPFQYHRPNAYTDGLKGLRALRAENDPLWNWFIFSYFIAYLMQFTK